MVKKEDYEEANNTLSLLYEAELAQKRLKQI